MAAPLDVIINMMRFSGCSGYLQVLLTSQTEVCGVHAIQLLVPDGGCCSLPPSLCCRAAIGGSGCLCQWCFKYCSKEFFYEGAHSLQSTAKSVLDRQVSRVLFCCRCLIADRNFGRRMCPVRHTLADTTAPMSFHSFLHAVP